MFWAKVDAVPPLLTNTLSDNSPNKKGQADRTTNHAMERQWVYMRPWCGRRENLQQHSF